MCAWLGNNTHLTTRYRFLTLSGRSGFGACLLSVCVCVCVCCWFDWLCLSSGRRLAGMLELCNILTNVNFPGFQLGLRGRRRGRQIVQVSHDCVTPGFDPVPGCLCSTASVSFVWASQVWWWRRRRIEWQGEICQVLTDGTNTIIWVLKSQGCMWGFQTLFPSAIVWLNRPNLMHLIQPTLLHQPMLFTFMWMSSLAI